MKKLTSKITFLNKRIFPAIWFGFLALFVAISIIAGGDVGPGSMFIFMPIIMAAVGYFIMKMLLFDLIDEVYDEGDTLLLKNPGKEIRISLRDIKNVNYQTMMNPQRVTLSLRHETELGKEISFSPPMNLIPFRKNKDIEELIDRIDRARG